MVAFFGLCKIYIFTHNEMGYEYLYVLKVFDYQIIFLCSARIFSDFLRIEPYERLWLLPLNAVASKMKKFLFKEKTLFCDFFQPNMVTKSSIGIQPNPSLKFSFICSQYITIFKCLENSFQCFASIYKLKIKFI